MVLCIIFVGMATFSKEQGITVVGVCCAYEIFIVHSVNNVFLFLSYLAELAKTCN